ncbi:hypothetical protein C7M84_001406 [Penaeus vannamei]|uniref:Uncharacterized protein n=1 Tax=Penaeus vannamei TaxID=6689 RepID=A0A423TTT0_PENVA|nr:hypothetical protein C7M84_001406 [Penaeus vannamei]
MNRPHSLLACQSTLTLLRTADLARVPCTARRYAVATTYTYTPHPHTTHRTTHLPLNPPPTTSSTFTSTTPLLTHQPSHSPTSLHHSPSHPPLTHHSPIPLTSPLPPHLNLHPTPPPYSPPHLPPPSPPNPPQPTHPLPTYITHHSPPSYVCRSSPCRRSPSPTPPASVASCSLVPLLLPPRRSAVRRQPHHPASRPRLTSHSAHARPSSALAPLAHCSLARSSALVVSCPCPCCRHIPPPPRPAHAPPLTSAASASSPRSLAPLTSIPFRSHGPPLHTSSSSHHSTPSLAHARTTHLHRPRTLHPAAARRPRLREPHHPPRIRLHLRPTSYSSASPSLARSRPTHSLSSAQHLHSLALPSPLDTLMLPHTPHTTSPTPLALATIQLAQPPRQIRSLVASRCHIRLAPHCCSPARSLAPRSALASQRSHPPLHTRTHASRSLSSLNPPSSPPRPRPPLASHASDVVRARSHPPRIDLAPPPRNSRSPRLAPRHNHHTSPLTSLHLITRYLSSPIAPAHLSTALTPNTLLIHPAPTHISHPDTNHTPYPPLTPNPVLRPPAPRPHSASPHSSSTTSHLSSPTTIVRSSTSIPPLLYHSHPTPTHPTHSITTLTPLPPPPTLPLITTHYSLTTTPTSTTPHHIPHTHPPT